MPLRFRILLITLVTFLSHPVMAYVPTGPHLLDLMIKAQGPSRSMEMIRNVWTPSDAESVTEVEESVRFLPPDRLRVESGAWGNKSIAVSAGDDYLLIVDKTLVADQPSDTELFSTLLFRKDRPELVERMTTLGVDLEMTSLVRLEEGIGYRIGTEEGSHVILRKNTFLPVRFRLVPTPENGVAKEVVFRYQDWSKFGRSEIPKRIEVQDEEGILQVIDVREVKIGARVKPDLFDLDDFRSRYPGLERPSDVTAESERIQDVSESLEQFRKQFEN